MEARQAHQELLKICDAKIVWAERVTSNGKQHWNIGWFLEDGSRSNNRIHLHSNSDHHVNLSEAFGDWYAEGNHKTTTLHPDMPDQLREFVIRLRGGEV